MHALALRRPLSLCPRIALRQALFCATGVVLVSVATAQRQWVLTGTPVLELQAIEDEMVDYIERRDISAAALAVTRNGRLVYSRGFNYTTSGSASTEPDSLFRIASLSKAITAVGTLRLVEAGHIGLDQNLNTILDMSGWLDARAQQITIRHLLQHTAGFDRNTATVPAAGSILPGGVMHPIIADVQISQALGRPLPIDRQAIIDYMQEMQLDFAPGTEFHYSNLGYMLLGLVIEQITGLDYETYTLREVWGPIGASRSRLGGTLLSQALPGEVAYEQPAAIGFLLPMMPSVTGSGGLVPAPYGAVSMDNVNSAGAWVTSAPAYARFLAAFDDPANSPLLSESMINTMWSREAAVWGASSSWYGMGWSANSLGNQWHDGSLPGTFTYMVRRADGVTFVALFNEMPTRNPIFIDLVINRGINAITTWPSHDLFDSRGAFSTFHAGCAGTVGEPGIRQLSGTRPRLGDALGIELTSLPTGGANVPFVALDGAAPTPLSLGPLAPGCDLLGSWTFVVPMVNTAGRAELTLPLRSGATGLVGARLYLQGAVTDPVNPLGVIFTRGANVLIGQ